MEPGDRAALRRDGYVVLRQVIPPELLPGLQTAHDALVEQMARVQGLASIAGVGRTNLGGELAHAIDVSTAACVDYWTHPSFHGVSSNLLGVEDAAAQGMMMLCDEVRPEEEQTKGIWHRDFYPSRCAPLESYANDMDESGPRYIQWNLCLHDDDVLWVVPKSHNRRATPEEDACLRSGGFATGRGAFREPLPNALHVQLKAGDGVAYASPAILHWGSQYGRVKRRTLHGGFAVPGIGHSSPTPFLPHLTLTAQAAFQRWSARHVALLDKQEAALRAALVPGGASRFAELVDGLVPGRGVAGRAHSTVLLSKAARRCFFYHHTEQIVDVVQEPPQEVGNTDKGLISANQPGGLFPGGTEIWERFTPAESVKLWGAFEHIDAALQQPGPHQGGLGWEPGFQGGLSSYAFHETLPSEQLVPRLGRPAL
jgi:hypothetical protein